MTVFSSLITILGQVWTPLAVKTCWGDSKPLVKQSLNQRMGPPVPGQEVLRNFLLEVVPAPNQLRLQLLPNLRPLPLPKLCPINLSMDPVGPNNFKLLKLPNC